MSEKSRLENATNAPSENRDKSAEVNEKRGALLKDHPEQSKGISELLSSMDKKNLSPEGQMKIIDGIKNSIMNGGKIEGDLSRDGFIAALDGNLA